MCIRDSLYLGQLDERYKDSGNVGQLDLILALKWVRDNIEYFGGDPDCVTTVSYTHLLPPILLNLCASRYLVEGIKTSGMKG